MHRTSRSAIGLALIILGGLLLNRTSEVQPLPAKALRPVQAVPTAAPAPIVLKAPVPVAMPAAERHPATVAEVRFGEWLARFANVPQDRPILAAEGRALAVERRVRLKKMIDTNPEEALKYIVRDSVRS